MRLKWKVCKFRDIFGSFLDTPSHGLWVTQQLFAKWKASWREISVVSFMNIAFVVAKLWMFKHFPSSKKIPFLGAFLWFFAHSSPKFGQIPLKFGTAMQANILYHIYSVFWCSPENCKNLTQKSHFVVGFQKFFEHILFRPMGDAPIFAKMKGLTEVHNPSKCH